MANGQKTGGRAKGTPNKRTTARRLGVEELLEKHRYDPLEAMIAEASDPKVDPDVRRSLHGSIAPYVYPKRKALEAKVEGSTYPTYAELVGLSEEQLLGIVLETLTDEDLAGEIKKRAKARATS